MVAKRQTIGVITRTQKSRKQAESIPMAVVLRDVPFGYNWGFSSREDTRMHLQVVSRKHFDLGYKVWLERNGRRTIEPAADIPPRVLKKLTAEIEAGRKSIEAEWVHFMVKKGWLRLAVRGPIITLTAYPNTPIRFYRTIDIRDHLAPEFAARIGPRDVALNEEFAVVALCATEHENRQPWVQIAPVLWGAYE